MSFVDTGTIARMAIYFFSLYIQLTFNPKYTTFNQN